MGAAYGEEACCYSLENMVIFFQTVTQVNVISYSSTLLTAVTCENVNFSLNKQENALLCTNLSHKIPIGYVFSYTTKGGKHSSGLINLAFFCVYDSCLFLSFHRLALFQLLPSCCVCSRSSGVCDGFHRGLCDPACGCGTHGASGVNGSSGGLLCGGSSMFERSCGCLIVVE